jgi:hypothetical protein
MVDNKVVGDTANFYQFGFQDPATTMLEGIYLFNLHLLFIIIGIVLLVGWLLFFILTIFIENSNSTVTNFTHSNIIEIIWTSRLSFILQSKISFPKFNIKNLGKDIFFYFNSTSIIDIANFLHLDEGKILFDFVSVGVLAILVIFRYIYLFFLERKWTDTIVLFMAIPLALFSFLSTFVLFIFEYAYLSGARISIYSGFMSFGTLIFNSFYVEIKLYLFNIVLLGVIRLLIFFCVIFVIFSANLRHKKKSVSNSINFN